MWNEVFVESKVATNPITQRILEKIQVAPTYIEDYSKIWGRAKKPYLQKRDSLNLFIAKKEGQLIKPAPDAYGTQGDPHYYYIHAYNCIYECQYCYLQGYFNTPDIVIFVNHEDIIAEMENCLKNHPTQSVWFHAGEFSDSLALSHLTGELGLYVEFCKKYPQAIIELRTKSANVREILKLAPIPNLIVSFSLSPSDTAQRVDLKTPKTELRLQAMKELHKEGWKVAAHFDPVIYIEGFEIRYGELLNSMQKLNLLEELQYLSLGVVRFTKDVYREIENNYPESLIHSGPMIKSFDGKIRYNRPMRMWILNTLKELALNAGIHDGKIYFCMESES